jgi:hypothetical protein
MTLRSPGSTEMALALGNGGTKSWEAIPDHA